MGIEADTSSPWTPANVVCAVSCHQVIRSVFDPLALPDVDGKVEPYLAKAITPNADYTQWTVTARDGVTFHDGTPFNGAAIADNLNRQRKSFLTGKAIADVTDVSVSASDPQSVVITVKRPWVAFPVYLTGQIGYMASPTWLKAVDADPTKATQPVGTGPFIFVSYSPGGDFKAKRNPNYWNKPFPYLDTVDFRPIPDAKTRASALESGDVDIIHTTDGDSIKKFRAEPDKFPMTESSKYAETGYTMLNVNDPNAPLGDVRLRCALAWATDNQGLIDQFDAGVDKQATGPFSPGQLGNLADSGFPLTQDMDKAKQMIADYKKDHPGQLTIALATTQDQTALEIAQQQQQWWQEAGVDKVTINQVEQGQYIVIALQGNFQAFQWRNHGGLDLDAQYIWWSSEDALPLGQLALNFGRIRDPIIDAALNDNRGQTDPAKKQADAEAVNKEFGKQCYNLWSDYTTWGIPHKPTVHGTDTFVLPSGNVAALGAGIAGSFNINGVWISK
jgi:peptide/nickel transport system substrate-binding protein